MTYTNVTALHNAQEAFLVLVAVPVLVLAHLLAHLAVDLIRDLIRNRRRRRMAGPHINPAAPAIRVRFRRRGGRWMRRTRGTTHQAGPRVDTRPAGVTSLAAIRGGKTA